MLKYTVNRCKISLTIQTDGPLLIKSGIPNLDSTDMTPVKTWRNGEQEVFIPGSSLKGLIRSQVERAVNSINENTACNLIDDNSFCGKRLENRFSRSELDTETAQIYAASCPACRLFGSTVYAARISVKDAYLDEGSSSNTEYRNGVSIDRFTGGAARGRLFDMDVVPAGTTFTTELVLRNFEIWQLGAIAVFLQDLQDGLIRIGSAKSRGLGAVSGTITNFTLSVPRTGNHTKNIIPGLGAALQDGSYGTTQNDELPVSDAVKETKRGIYFEYSATAEQLDGILETAVEQFINRIRQWSNN